MHKTIYNIQALRGFAVLLVVFYHIIPIELKYNPTFIVMPNFFKIGNIGVDIFFIISGFIMVFVTKNYSKSKKDFFKFLYLRVTRIYPLYWFYSIILLPILFIRPEWINSSQAGQVNLLSSFLLIPSETLPLIMVGWSLIHEIYFYIIFGLFILFFNRDKLPYFAFSWLLFIIIPNLLLEYNTPILKLVLHPLTIEFIFGIFIGIYFINYSKKIYFSKLFLLLSFVGLLFISFYVDAHSMNNWERILFFGFPSAFIVFFAIEVEKTGFILNKTLIKLGDMSYSIYLVHLLSLNLVAKIFNIFLIPNLLFEILMVISMIIVTLFSGFLSYRYIEQPIIIYSQKIYQEKLK